MNIPKNVRVIAVSKLQSLEKISKLIETRNQKDFGENYVQEALPKIQNFKNLKLTWHFIGHLQKNKVRSVIGIFEYIHSVDSTELIERISEIATSMNLRQKVLLQVNVAGEISKEGFRPQDLEENFSKLKELKGVEIVGLMTMPPLQSDPKANKNYFAELQRLANKLGLKELSMGTSHDYQEAIECGATMIRLGTALFGARPKG